MPTILVKKVKKWAGETRWFIGLYEALGNTVTFEGGLLKNLIGLPL